MLKDNVPIVENLKICRFDVMSGLQITASNTMGISIEIPSMKRRLFQLRLLRQPPCDMMKDIKSVSEAVSVRLEKKVVSVHTVHTRCFFCIMKFEIYGLIGTLKCNLIRNMQYFCSSIT